MIITLHRELWEGLLKLFLLLIVGYCFTPGLVNFIYFNTSHNNKYFGVSTIKTYPNRWVRSVYTSSKGPLI